jgi:predicted adenine nucleotide alpha hydrolase (AANH) superfamily ATPase
MKKAFGFACEHHFDFMTTTLSLSPHKDAEAINSIGKELEKSFATADSQPTTRFLFADFKKQDGYKRSLELSKKFNLYRQDYCGCEFSLYNTNKT